MKIFQDGQGGAVFMTIGIVIQKKCYLCSLKLIMLFYLP
jgi:hypothetical protein